MKQINCADKFSANSSGSFIARECCNKYAAFDKRTPGLSKEEIRCSDKNALCSKNYCCYDEQSDTMKSSSKGLNKNNIGEPLAK